MNIFIFFSLQFDLKIGRSLGGHSGHKICDLKYMRCNYVSVNHTNAELNKNAKGEMERVGQEIFK